LQILMNKIWTSETLFSKMINDIFYESLIFYDFKHNKEIIYVFGLNDSGKIEVKLFIIYNLNK
jgi:hypothetical protein